jgi:Fe-Mn family superoxide dismutase
MFKQSDLNEIIKQSVKDTFAKSGVAGKPQESVKEMQSKTILQTVKEKLNESFVLTPKAFLLKTEFLSSKAKEAHEKLYNNYVKAFDKIVPKLQTANTEEADSTGSVFSSLKIDEQYNLNAIKLHELYFNNISSLNSTISIESLPYMRLSRDFGTFEKWQYDFRACAMSAREGWAITYYEPMRGVYMNCIIDGHNVGVPMGCIPVIVMDMWAHAYYRDYLDDKKSYVNAMMRELNWNVVEARMTVAERSRLGDIYEIKPFTNDIPHKMLSAIPQDNAPIGKEQIDSEQVAPSTEVGDWQQPKPPVGGARGSF